MECQKSSRARYARAARNRPGRYWIGEASAQNLITSATQNPAQCGVFFSCQVYPKAGAQPAPVEIKRRRREGHPAWRRQLSLILAIISFSVSLWEVKSSSRQRNSSSMVLAISTLLLRNPTILCSSSTASWNAGLLSMTTSP